MSWPQQNNSSIVLSRNPRAIKNYSKIIQWIKSRNCDVIGDFFFFFFFLLSNLFQLLCWLQQIYYWTIFHSQRKKIVQTFSLHKLWRWWYYYYNSKQLTYYITFYYHFRATMNGQLFCMLFHDNSTSTRMFLHMKHRFWKRWLKFF